LLNSYALFQHTYIMRKSGKAPYIPSDTFAAAIAAQTGIHGKRDAALLYLTHYTGMRVKELANLKLKTLINAGDRQLKECLRLPGDITKGKKAREVFFLNQTARTAVQSYLNECRLSDLDAYVFISQKGDGFTPGSMQRLIAIAYGRAGIDASSHSGRRSFATNMIELGADLFAVKELLGHACISTTQAYLATSPARLKRMVEMLN
jgi:integrase/recombinase XerD